MAKHLRLSAMVVAAILILGACGSGTTATSTPAGGESAAPPPSEAPAGSESAAPAGSPSAAGAIPEQGVDDGSTITMWSRAATETRVQSQVDEYNATHQNKVELRLVPTD